MKKLAHIFNKNNDYIFFKSFFYKNNIWYLYKNKVNSNFIKFILNCCYSRLLISINIYILKLKLMVIIPNLKWFSNQLLFENQIWLNWQVQIFKFYNYMILELLISLLLEQIYFIFINYVYVWKWYMLDYK